MFSTVREERNQTQVLRQQQDEAYLASLRADQEKDRKKREEQEQLRQEEEKVRQTALAEERRRRVSLIFCSICSITQPDNFHSASTYSQNQSATHSSLSIF